MNFSLPRFALQRPVTVVMLSLCMLILGLIAWFRMPLKFLPDIDQPFMGVSIPYPGASPEQVEQQIAIPVEGEFRTVSGLRQIRTISNSDGCFISMLFNLDTDMTLATGDIRDRMERLKLVLPAEVDRMFIQRFSSQSIPVIAIGVFREGDQEKFVHLVRTIMEPRLRRVAGVADVQIRSPIPEQEVVVEFDQNTLHSQNLGLAQIIEILRAGSLNVSIGPLEEGDTRYLVRTLGEYRHLDDLASIVVGPNGLRLRDIATVRYSARGEPAHVSLDGKGGAVLMVNKESEANTVSTCEGVRAALEDVLALPAFEDVAHHIFFDQSSLITSALENLLHEGIYGAAMSILILFFFLHRVRPTIIVALTIPTSLVISLVFMFFAGMTLNLVTMASMIISVGMLVDNSIVVVENIIRHRQLGYGPAESAERGAREVGLAILASTTTTWVVFVPMYYLEAGQMSVFMEQLGLPLIIALAGSLTIALTLIPLTMSHIHGNPDETIMQRFKAAMRRERVPESTPETRAARAAGAASPGSHSGPRAIRWFISQYAGVLYLAIRWRIAALAMLAAIIAVTYYGPFSRMGLRDMPKLDTREVKLEVDLDPNFNMAMATELFDLIQGEIQAMREELGIKNVLTFYQRGGGVIEAYLYTDEDGPIGKNPPYDTEDVMIILAERLGKRVPGAEFRFMLTDTGNTGEAAVSVRLRGDDTRMIAEYAEQFRMVMNAIPLLHDVNTDIERSKQEMQIRIDEPLASIASVNPLVIAQTVDAALRGARLPEMKQGGREIPVWAQFREEDRASKANLDNVAVLSDTGALIPLNQLVEFNKAASPASIQRVNGKNVVTLRAKTNTDNLSAVQLELAAAIDAFELPPGYSIEMAGQLQELGETMMNFTTTLLMAIVLIYLVMAALFESYLLPLSILTTVPLALGGAVWMLFFTGLQMDTVTFVGCVLMSGVIVNNGIVIVDHINTLRKRGLPRQEAIVQAGKDRFRPVMMTALTTILGLVPLAVAKTGGAATFAGLGQALIGGMSVGTILTLLVVPLFYTLLDDFQNWIADFINSFRGSPALSVDN